MTTSPSKKRDDARQSRHTVMLCLGFWLSLIRLFLQGSVCCGNVADIAQAQQVAQHCGLAVSAGVRVAMTTRKHAMMAQAGTRESSIVS